MSTASKILELETYQEQAIAAYRLCDEKDENHITGDFVLFFADDSILYDSVMEREMSEIPWHIWQKKEWI